MAGTAKSVGVLAWLGFVPCLVAFIGITDTQARPSSTPAPPPRGPSLQRWLLCDVRAPSPEARLVVCKAWGGLCSRDAARDCRHV